MKGFPKVERVTPDDANDFIVRFDDDVDWRRLTRAELQALQAEINDVLLDDDQ